MKDIETKDDVKLMVDTFYDKIRKDDVLGPIFNERIKDNWQVHLEKMYKFWGNILLPDVQYNGKPFPPHATMNLEKHHFNQWLNLFFDTLEENFSGEKTEEAKNRASSIAAIFYSKIESLK